MPRPDNENQYKYGAYDYRTADEDARRDREDWQRQHDENARTLERHQADMQREAGG